MNQAHEQRASLIMHHGRDSLASLPSLLTAALDRMYKWGLGFGDCECCHHPHVLHHQHAKNGSAWGLPGLNKFGAGDGSHYHHFLAYPIKDWDRYNMLVETVKCWWLLSSALVGNTGGCAACIDHQVAPAFSGEFYSVAKGFWIWAGFRKKGVLFFSN